MARRRLNPRSLAERLDAALPPGRVDRPAADEDPLVDMALRLSASPPPEPISPAAKARIRGQVLNAYRQQVLSNSHGPSRIVLMTRRIGVAVAALVMLIGSLSLVYALSNTLKSSSNVIEEPIPTGPATPFPTIVVIEGVVETIHSNMITVLGVDIEVDPDDPILAQIQVGDHVRVEGELVDQGNAIIIAAVRITVNRMLGAIDESNIQPHRLQPGPPIVVPPGCEITGFDGNDPTLQCTGNQDDK